MRIRTLIAALLLSAAAGGVAPAQFKEPDPEGARLGQAETSRWQCGMTVQAVGGPCFGLVGYAPVPVEWPEQQVKIVGEEISPEAKVSYTTVDGTVRVMVVRIPRLAAGETVQALVTYEITRRAILAPTDTGRYVLPDKRKLDFALRRYLGESPKIESNDRRIEAIARQIGADQTKAWARVEAIYDWVRANVEYKNGPLKGAVAALEDRTGDCEELTSLFIAICRAADIPARTVWVPGHCYPEFYLMDENGEGHWFPCQAAGTRAFGEMPETRPILQKGDDFHPPWNRRSRMRYLAEHLEGAGGKPRVQFVRKAVGK